MGVFCHLFERVDPAIRVEAGWINSLLIKSNDSLMELY